VARISANQNQRPFENQIIMKTPNLNPPTAEMSLEELQQLKEHLTPLIDIIKRVHAAFDTFQAILLSEEEVQILGLAFEAYMQMVPPELLAASGETVLKMYKSQKDNEQ
jgi:hypothetical protein